MPRPTPARLLYMIIGLLLGLVATVAAQMYLVPSIAASLPFRTSAPTPVVPAGPTQFSGSVLERVMFLNLIQERNAVTLRLNSLEVYQDGFTFTYTLIGSPVGVSPLTLEPETFQVTDDRGLTYSLSPLGSGAVPSAGLTTGFASFTPAPPADVRSVRVVVPNVLSLAPRPREGQPRVIAGPWDFQVPVRS